MKVETQATSDSDVSALLCAIICIQQSAHHQMLCCPPVLVAKYVWHTDIACAANVSLLVFKAQDNSMMLPDSLRLH